MKQQLEGLGWKMIHECDTCKGIKQTYTHEGHTGYEILTVVRTNVFSILRENRIVAGPFWGYQLDETIKNYQWL